jgi:hypothetical protein
MAPAILILCNITDDREVQLAMILNSFITSLEEDAPPVIFGAHTCPEWRGRGDLEKEFSVLSSAMSGGIDCCIVGEPAGMRLACEVRAEVMRQASYADFFNRSLEQHRQVLEDYLAIEEKIEDGVWDYLRVRLQSAIPRADYDMPPCQVGAVIGNYTVGRKLGEGGSGKVFALQEFGPPSERAHESEVMKAISKSSRTSMVGIKILSNEIAVMLELATWRHPNVIQLREVCHSETQILLRMEDGGPVDLYKCLRTHELQRDPLSLHKASTLIQQALTVICHMHLGPKVVHRDIKPENIVVRETPHDIIMKICDFDLARIMPEPRLSTFVGGTFPFMAPEMLKDTAYAPFPADIWSMAIVFLEILGFCGVLA